MRSLEEGQLMTRRLVEEEEEVDREMVRGEVGANRRQRGAGYREVDWREVQEKEEEAGQWVPLSKKG